VWGWSRAGWSTRGYFGSGIRVFGNPGGALEGDGYFVPGQGTGPQPAFVGQLAASAAGFLLGGFSTVAETFTATRFNAALDPLAEQGDLPIANMSDGINFVFSVPGRFVAQDFNGIIADSSNEGVSWALATNPGSGVINSAYGLSYDDAADTVFFGDNLGGVEWAPNASPLVFTGNLISSVGIACVGYKGPGTGIELCIDNLSVVYKSTSGGVGWAAVGAVGFEENATSFIGFGQTHWLAVGSSGSGGVQFQLSTDDGATWTSIAAFPGPNNLGAAASVATDGAGNWVVISLSEPPDNYWVSNDDGVTWVSPNLFSAQFGPEQGSLVFHGGQWNVVWNDPTDTLNFLSSSADGRAWTVGPTVTEPG
jgi:hypothetical protein